MSGQQLASGPAVIVAASGAGSEPDGTLSNVSGIAKRCRRSKGQTTAIARPTTRSCDTNAFSPCGASALRVIEVAPRVAAVIPVVAHHEEMAARNDDVESDGRRLHRVHRPVRR